MAAKSAAQKAADNKAKAEAKAAQKAADAAALGEAGAPAPKPGTVEAAAVAAPEVKAGWGKDSVDIVRGKLYIRSYSEAKHGKEWKRLAQDFLDKQDAAGKPHQPVNPADAKGVLVKFRVEDVDPETRVFKGWKDAESFFKDRAEALAFVSRLDAKNSQAVAFLVR